MPTSTTSTVRVCSDCKLTADTVRYVERRAAVPGNPYSDSRPFQGHEHEWTVRPRAELRTERAEANAAAKRDRQERLEREARLRADGYSEPAHGYFSPMLITRHGIDTEDQSGKQYDEQTETWRTVTLLEDIRELNGRFFMFRTDIVLLNVKCKSASVQLFVEPYTDGQPRGTAWGYLTTREQQWCRDENAALLADAAKYPEAVPYILRRA